MLIEIYSFLINSLFVVLFNVAVRKSALIKGGRSDFPIFVSISRFLFPSRNLFPDILFLFPDFCFQAEIYFPIFFSLKTDIYFFSFCDFLCIKSANWYNKKP